MKEYTIVKDSEFFPGEKSLVSICGPSYERALAAKAYHEKEEPDVKFYIREVEKEAQWWNEGGLD